MAFEFFPYQNKQILTDKPEDGMVTQYNYYNGTYPGIDGEFELYSVTDDDSQNKINLLSYPGEYYSPQVGGNILYGSADGLEWVSLGSSITIDKLQIKGVDQESWGGGMQRTGWELYVADSDDVPIDEWSGNLLITGLEMNSGDDHLMNDGVNGCNFNNPSPYYICGDYTNEIDDSGQDMCNNCANGDGYNASVFGTARVDDFPRYSDQSFSTDSYNWSRGLNQIQFDLGGGNYSSDKHKCGNIDNSNDSSCGKLVFVVRTGADSNEDYIAWEGIDERDRLYTKWELPKRHIRHLFLHADGRCTTYAWGPNAPGVDVYLPDGTPTYMNMGNYSSFLDSGTGGSRSRDSHGDYDWESLTFNWEDVTYFPHNFEITMCAPTWTYEDVPDTTEALTSNSNYITKHGSFGYGWAENYNESTYYKLNPSSLIDFNNLYHPIKTVIGDVEVDDEHAYQTEQPVLFTPADIYPFRPISFMTDSLEYVDLQSFYEPGDGYEYATVPGNVRLGFRIAKDTSLPTPSYYGYDSDVSFNRIAKLDYDSEIDESNICLDEECIKKQFEGLRYKFVVLDWDADDSTTIEESIARYPTDYTDIIQSQYLYDTMYFEDVFDPKTGLYKYIEHQYIEPGIKNVHALVFSYIGHNTWNNEYDQDNIDYIQALNWRSIQMKIVVEQDLGVIQDFTDLGGNDFSFIPWPETTAIIGGLSSTSQYVNSVKSINQMNQFDTTERRDKSLTKAAYQNLSDGNYDELGDNLPNSDLSQIRFFTQPFDMNKLLMLNQNDVLPSTSEYNPYDSFSWEGGYWGHENDAGIQEYPEESCVGKLFINEEKGIDDNIIRKCKVELNTTNINANNTILDSSGNANKGIMIGDYTVSKAGKSYPVVRDSDMKIAAQGTDNKAF